MDNQMFCKNCGKALPAESQFCPYCMTKLVEETKVEAAHTKAKNTNKILIAIIAVLVVVGIAFAAIVIPKLTGNKDDSGVNANNIAQDSVDEDEDNKGGLAQVISKKSVEKDDNIGLMNIKINKNADNLTDTQKLLVQYFDKDYFRAPYNSLQRYPQVYEQAQLYFQCYVTKIIESNDEEYTALVEYEAYKPYDGGEETKLSTGDYVVIKGKQTESRFMEGDTLYYYGTYEGVDTYTVGGKSYTIPTIRTNRFTYVYYFDVVEPMYSVEEIRTIAKHIFGNDIKIRYTQNDDFENLDDYDYESYEGMYYTAELDNQSNANFSKYVFYAAWGGGIFDCKAQQDIERSITFSADFEHFYLQIFDKKLNVYTLECYNRNLEKIWSREFEETTTALLDYTADHIYLVTNGSMYIIDAETGENAVEPKYVGAKTGIRKLEDGILLVSDKRSDAVMKTDLVGNVQWTANLSYDLMYEPVIQLNGGNYVIQYEGSGDYDEYGNPIYTTNTAVITPDGHVEFDGETF